MTSNDDSRVQELEQIIGYTFVLKYLLHHARTSAGADPNNYDGNRRLSQLGSSVVHSVLAIMVFFIGGSRECTANLRAAFLDKKKYYTVAKRTGIDKYIHYDERTGPDSPEVLRKAINAIIAAVFLDSWSIKTTILVLLRIFFEAGDDRIFQELPSVSADTLNALSAVPKMILAQSSGAVDPSLLSSEQPTTRLEISPMVDRFLSDGSRITASMPTVLDRSTLENELDRANDFEFLRDDLWSPDEALTPIEGADEAENVSSLNIDETLSDEADASPTAGNHHVAARVRGCRGDNETTVEAPVLKRRCRVQKIDFSILHGQPAVEILSRERGNCFAQAIGPPESSYFSPNIMEKALKLEKNSLGRLAILILTIASPQSVLTLRNITKSERENQTIDSYRLACNMASKRRYTIIKELTDKNTLFRLLRWYHILDLFEQCGGSSTRSCTGYANTTMADFERPRRRRGNPSNNDDTEVAQDMMNDFFPGIGSDSLVYKQEFATIKQYRKLGQRLHLLTERFGRGILGLTLAPDPMLEISDRMILKPRNDVFRDFVKLLEESQIHWLRRCSEAALPLLRPLLEFTLDTTPPFQLESADPNQILKQPKCSDSLLQLIC